MTSTRWALRAATPDDRPAVHRLVLAANEFDGLPLVVTLDEIEEDLDDEAVVLATDTRVAVADDGDVVGYAFTLHMPSDVGLERAYVFGDVHPHWRRQGLGTELLAWGRARAAAPSCDGARSWATTPRCCKRRKPRTISKTSCRTW